jgi:hypothetical protein
VIFDSDGTDIEGVEAGFSLDAVLFLSASTFLHLRSLALNRRWRTRKYWLSGGQRRAGDSLYPGRELVFRNVYRRAARTGMLARYSAESAS